MNVNRHLNGKGLFLLMLLGITLNLNAQNLEEIKSQKPVTIHGSIGIAPRFYNVTGKTPSREPFSWVLQGNPVVTIYGISLPFSFYITDQQRDFRQPLNRFGISPYYKWVKLYLGYQSLNFSKYSLAGHSITGAGVELTPGNFRFAFMYGRLLKAIPERNDLQNTRVQIPAFRRKGAAVKIGYGTEDNFLDIVVLKAADDIGSLDSFPTSQKVLPAENLVASVITHQKLFNRVFFDAEFAQSIYTKDVTAEEIDSSGNLILLKPFSGLIKSHNSTNFSTAFETSLGYMYKGNGLKLHFQRVDPGYQSMGAYYFLNDLQNITIEPRVSLFKNKLGIGGSLGLQHDNVNNTKAATTQRTIGSANLNARPFKNYNLTIQYSNYGIGQKSGVSPLDTMIEISQSTQNIAVNQSYTLQGKKTINTFLLNYNRQNLTDDNVNTAKFSEYKTNMLIGGYSLFITPWRLNFGINYTHVAFKNNLQNNAYDGPSINLGKTLLKDKLNIGLSGAFTTNSINDSTDSKIQTLSFNAGFKITKKHRITARFYVNKRIAVSATSKSFTEINGEIRYVYRF